jgi:hypothetical protein
LLLPSAWPSRARPPDSPTLPTTSRQSSKPFWGATKSAQSTAMAMVGHKTESIYRRYAIVDEQMHREAAAKLDTWHLEQQAKAEAARNQYRRIG